MMNARKLALAVTLTAVTVLSACFDRSPDKGMPTAPKLVPGAQANTMGTCIEMSGLVTLANQVFGTGSPNVNSVLGKLDNLEKKVTAGNIADAQAQAMNIVQFVRDKAAEGRLAGTQEQITQFISGVLCYADLSPDTFLILPSDEPQIRTSSDGVSGVSLQSNTVTEPALLTLTTLADTGTPPLDTKLDKYPSYISITISSALTKPAIVSVCPKGDIPADVLARLRLGHQAAAGFEITPQADGTFLQCGPAASLASQSRLPGWLRTVASIFIPKPLYAMLREEADRGVGGLATEFSPFGTVDPELDARGVGGLATEFKKTPANRPGFGPAASDSNGGTGGPAKSLSGTGIALVPGGLASFDELCSEATVGTALDVGCRPVIMLTTPNGTPFDSVPVAWAVESGEGTIAPHTISTQACGSFGSAAPTTTDNLGKASVCWTLGPNGGTNRVTATPGIGGDAPAGVIFNPPVVKFKVEGLKITPTATATGGNFVFDNAAHAGSGTCSNELNPVLTYSNGEPPIAKGEYTLTVTCGEGSTVYHTVSATATISITAVAPSVTVSCPASVVFDGTPQTPCSATVTAPGLSLTPTPQYSDNTNVGTATASVSVSAGGNYAAASGSATFLITPAATTTLVTCSPTSLSYTGSALTPCSARTTGPDSLDAATVVTYTDNVNVGTATASATFTAGGNYLGSSGSATFAITAAATVTTVTCPTSATFTGTALTPCSAGATGAGGLSVPLTPTYSANVGAGTATASASYSGDANHTGSSGSADFTIDPAGTSVTVLCTATLAYDGTVRNPCTASVAGPVLSASLGVTYNPLSPRNAGGYTAAATFAAGGNYLGSANAESFAITQLAATATSGNATINFGAAVPTIPCTVSGLLGVDAGSVTCATTPPIVTVAGTYPTIPSVSPASPVNYDVLKVNGILTVAGYKQVGCFSSPLYNVMPESKSAQRKGSNLPVKCTLTTQQGAAVTTATGGISIMDAGTTPASPPVRTGNIVFSASNVFKYSNSGNYSYSLDTSPAYFQVGHYYYVIANWNDGSKSEGWFLLK